jgi:twinkle protein
MEEVEAGMINTASACISKMKMRGMGKENKQYMRIFPAGVTKPGLFGMHLITPTTKEVIITEGEYDAMAAYQESGIIALSLPQGASNLPDNVLPYLDHIEKIYLWMDND